MLERGRWNPFLDVASLDRESGVTYVNGQMVEYRSLAKIYTGREVGAVYRVIKNDLDEKLAVGLVSPGGLSMKLEMVAVTGEVFASFSNGRMGVGLGFSEGGFAFANAVVGLPPMSMNGETDLVVSVNTSGVAESYILADRDGEKLFLHEAKMPMTKNEDTLIVTSEMDPEHRREQIRRYRSLDQLKGNKAAFLYQVGARRLMEETDAIDLWAARLGQKMSWRVYREFTFFTEEIYSLFDIDLDHLPGAIARLFSHLGEDPAIV